MQIKTKYLGEIQISEADIIFFPKGLLGFENHRKFVLLNVPGNDHFKFLQDISNRHLAFLLINPWEFFKDYDIDLPDENLEMIGVNTSEENQMAIYTIVTIGQSFTESTTNLLAPIAINLIDKKGKQFILNDSLYTTKHELFPEGIGE